MVWGVGVLSEDLKGERKGEKREYLRYDIGCERDWESAMGGREVNLKVDKEKGGVKGVRRGTGHGDEAADIKGIQTYGMYFKNKWYLE